MEMIKTPHRFIGFSTDTKPATAEVGSTFYEIDKRETYICFDGTQWAFLSSAENHLDIGTTIDLNQAAGDYDLFSSNTQAIIIHHFSLYIPVDISGSGTLTSIAVATDDGTPIELVSSTDGAVANLTAGKLFLYDTQATMAVNKNIQLTIAGGAAGVTCNAVAWVEYTPTSTAAGYLSVG